jgi:MacB-like periplasmic core domain
MKPPRPIRGLIWQSRWLLHLASLLVPRARRKEWYAEWDAEIWHWAHFLYESGRLNHATRFEVVKHLWGAFSDAAWLRFNREKVLLLWRNVPRTSRFCLIAIGLVLVITIAASGFAPTVRWYFSSLPYKSPERLADLSFSGNFVHYHSDTLFLSASRWAQASKTAEAISAYSWQSAAISAGSRRVAVMSARVSPNFFEVLGINAGLGRLFSPGDDKACANCIVISNQLWKYGFHRDPAILGKEVAFQGNTSRVIGVLPARFWFISPEISVFILNQSHENSFNFADHTGALLRLRPGLTTAQALDEFRGLIADAGSSFGFARAEVLPIRNRVRQGIQIYLLFTMLAFVGSLALLAFRLIGAGSLRARLPWRDNSRWWLFFVFKTVLLLATCLVASLEGTRQLFLILTGEVPPLAGAISTWLFLVTTVLSVTWSLHDQCRRCRICLKRLSHEAYVGAPACMLLDWWGTELVCSQGHGLLHVTEMRASWLQMEQWIQLDESWKPLFEPEEVKAS